MVLAAVAFVWMAQWDRTSLESWVATIPLVLCGFGFGLAIAPVNAALLAWTKARSTVSRRPCSSLPGWSGCWSASRY